MMKITYDKNADAAYIYVVHPLREGQSKRTARIKDDIILDFDKKGKLLGVEVLNASKHLQKKVILQAQHLSRTTF